MGVRSGVPDLMFVLPDGGQSAGLELKRRGGKPSANQLAFAAELEACGGLWAFADSIDSALHQLEQWGVIKPQAVL